MKVTNMFRALRGPLAIAALALLLVGVTYHLMALSIDRNLKRDAENLGLDWAQYFARHMPDLEALVAGRKPSREVRDFLRQASAVGQVFCVKVFDPHGFLRYDSRDPDMKRPLRPSLASHNRQAASVAKSGRPFAVAREGRAPEKPLFYAEAYLPIIRNGEIVAVAEVYVDQTRRRQILEENLLQSGFTVALLCAAAFGFPAFAFLYRSRQKREAEKWIARKNLKLRTVLDNMSQGFCMFDADHRLVLVNTQYRDIYGLSEEEVRTGMSVREMLEQRVANGGYHGNDPQAYIEERLQRVLNGDRTRDVHELPDGRIVAVEHRPLPGGGWLTTHDDITELRRYEEEVAYFAAHDTVTGVMNRRSFEERVCEHHLTAGGAKYAVLCVNVDNFKTANQLLGHAGGDRLLRAIAERLQECVSEGDIVSRLGSDNFVILQVADDQPNQARVLAHYICEVMQEPFEVDGNSLTSGVSIGIAIAPCDGTEPGTLITHADLALRLAKREGRSCYRFFEAEMDARMRQRRQLENDLRDALSKGELELFYQPVINAQSEEISGCEALLRWNHPEHGPISPAEFIPLAEEVGVIVPVGEWILREACREAANWPSHMRIAVNVSAAQFRSGNLVASVVSALAASGLDPVQLELEITETVLLQDCQSTLDTLHMLRNLGVRIAMDDFGTGYSSLSYLRSFPFDKIKLDGSFVYDLAKGNGSTAIIRAVSSLGVTTTAEGVETREQFDIIRSEGYSEVQGYYFSRPVPAEDLHAMYFPERPRAVSAA